MCSKRTKALRPLKLQALSVSLWSRLPWVAQSTLFPPLPSPWRLGMQEQRTVLKPLAPRQACAMSTLRGHLLLEKRMQKNYIEQNSWAPGRKSRAVLLADAWLLAFLPCLAIGLVFHRAAASFCVHKRRSSPWIPGMETLLTRTAKTISPTISPSSRDGEPAHTHTLGDMGR